MKIKSSDGRVINVPANFQAKAKALMEAGNHSGMEALYNEIESQSFKKGGMLKRKDGSYSKRGLWDNIRANRGSGKKPTKQMLEQERKIRAKHAAGGTVFKGYVTKQPISNAVPWHSSTIHEEGGYTEGPNIGELGPTKLSSSLWEAPYSDAGLGYIFGETPRYPMPLPTNMQQKAIEAQGLYNTPGDVNSLVDRRYINPLKSGDAYDDLYYDAGLSRAESEKGMQYLSDTYGERSPQRFQYGKGGYTVKRSSARKGKTHVVIGPDGTKKYFGDSKLGQHPKDPARKKSFYARHAKNLKGNPYFRAFARATWADGGKLGQGIYDMGLMPYGMGGHLQEGPHSYLEEPYLKESVDLQYADGGYIFYPKMNYDGTIRGANTPAYNEREKMLFGGLFGKMKENKGFFGDLARNPLEVAKDLGKASADTTLSTIGAVSGIKALKDVINPYDYKSGGLKGIDNVTSGVGDVAGTALKFIPVTAPYAGAVSAVGGLANNAFGIDKRNYHPEWHQSGFEKATGTLKQAGDFAGMFYNPVGAAGNLGKAAQVASQIGKYAGLGNMGLGIGQQLASGQGINPMQLLQLGMSAGGLGIFGGGNQGGGNNPATSNINMSGQPGDIGTQGQGMFEFPSARYGGYVRMDDGGQTGMVPINVEGGNFSEGSGPDARKGELLVLNGKIIKNYVGRPPHPAEGQNPMGDDEAPEGLIVIPKNRTKEYLEAGLQKRQQMERSLVSQQQHREMKKSRMMGDGGYYSFGMGDMGMGEGGPIGNPETINDITYGTMKKGGWIQKATASIKRRGTEGVCTGSKFGSSSCPPGSRRYNLAKTFRKMAKARKHEYGGFVDPVTGSHTVMYRDGAKVKGDASRWNAWNNPYTVVAMPDPNSSFAGDSVRVFPGQRYPQGMPYIKDLGTSMGVTPTDYGIMTRPDVRIYQDSTYMEANPERLPVRPKKGDGGQLPESLLRTRMRASGASPQEINDYVTARYGMGGNVNPNLSYGRAIVNKYEMGGPTNVDRSAIYAGMRNRLNYGGRLRYDLGAVVSPEQTSLAGVYPGMADVPGYGSFNYFDPAAENYTPGMEGWYGYQDGVPTSITDPIYTKTLNEIYRGYGADTSTGQGSQGNSTFNYTGPGSVARMQNSQNWTGYPEGFKGIPYSYSSNSKYGLGTEPTNPASSASNVDMMDPDVRRAMKAYGIAGGLYGAGQIAEGLLSKPETYKRMGLYRQRPELLNPREALADARRTMAGYKYAGRQTGPNQRNFLTSLAAKDAAARAGIYGQYDNANAQITNAYKDALVRDQMALMQQDQVAQMYDAQSRAARRNMIRSGFGDLAGTAGNYANMAIQAKYLNKMGNAGSLT